MRFGAPSYHLSQAEDYQYDQQQKADQKEYPRHIRHGHAKAMFMTRSIGHIRDYEEHYVGDSQNDQIPTFDQLVKPRDQGLVTHCTTSEFALWSSVRPVK
jgi:hypothetical protein